MNLPESTKPSTWLPLLFIALALTGFLGTSYWHQKQEFSSLQRNLSDARETLSGQLKEQNKVQNERFMAFMKLSQEVAVQDTRLAEIQNKVQLHKNVQDNQILELDTAIKVQKQEQTAVFSALDTRFDEIKKTESQQTKKLNHLELKLEETQKGNGPDVSKLQRDLDTLKRLVETQAKEIKRMRSALNENPGSEVGETQRSLPTKTSVSFPLSQKEPSPVKPSSTLSHTNETNGLDLYWGGFD